VTLGDRDPLGHPLAYLHCQSQKIAQRGVPLDDLPYLSMDWAAYGQIHRTSHLTESAGMEMSWNSKGSLHALLNPS